VTDVRLNTPVVEHLFAMHARHGGRSIGRLFALFPRTHAGNCIVACNLHTGAPDPRGGVEVGNVDSTAGILEATTALNRSRVERWGLPASSWSVMTRFLDPPGRAGVAWSEIGIEAVRTP
jgi:hypothetical protein